MQWFRNTWVEWSKKRRVEKQILSWTKLKRKYTENDLETKKKGTKKGIEFKERMNSLKIIRYLCLERNSKFLKEWMRCTESKWHTINADVDKKFWYLKPKIAKPVTKRSKLLTN